VVMNMRFPGQYEDSESGLYQNYFRDYDPGIGRYVESDPIGLAGGVNTYSYVVNSPITIIDFFGLCVITGQVANTDWYVDNLSIDIFSRRRNKEWRVIFDISASLHASAVINCQKKCDDCDDKPEEKWTLYEYADASGVVVPWAIPKYYIPDPSKWVKWIRRVLLARDGFQLNEYRGAANDLLQSLVEGGADEICRLKPKNTNPIRL